MRGGFLHTTVLLGPIAEYFRVAGAEVLSEHPVEPGPSPRCVDLLVRHQSETLVVEAELTPRRVQADIEKARALHAGLLLIVTPTTRAAAAIERQLGRLIGTGLNSRGIEIQIRPLGPALTLLRTKYPLITNPIQSGKTNRKGDPATLTGKG